ISFAGEKDKKAVTEQYIAIRNLKKFKEFYDFRNVKLKYVGSFSEPVRISDIVGNYFKIVVRDLSKKEIQTFQDNIEIYKRGFINYFDEQRFGDIRTNNHLIGKAIIKRNWEEACKILLTFTSDEESPLATKARLYLRENWGDWRIAIKKFPRWLDVELAVLNHLVRNPEDFLGALKKIHRRLLKLFVHAYQSYLWNVMVSKYIQEVTSDYNILRTRFGELAIPKRNEDVYQLQNLEFPIIGYTTDLKDYPEYEEIIREVLNSEGVEIEDFFFVDPPYLSSEGSKRRVVVTPTNLKYVYMKSELTLEFILPRGSYATMFIKHLFI
ncbi:MAG TPA: tRNA pseudouridine(13) synthase TruD, partial [Candidatus Nanopusillus sp.]|nr:tRNA pseudouridine(13) synthase TruD [Candidatus Nanopusillus sp.]